MLITLISPIRSNASCDAIISACNVALDAADATIKEMKGVILYQDGYIKQQDELTKQLQLKLSQPKPFYERPEVAGLIGLTVGLIAGILASK
jgi:hypothetical protein